ncbi:hypothetical protein [Lentzea roselyniae]|uniref:hypothetical protein n=1 Tax=Lentzea roselyniae TaxID=531940 RepID=UPI0031FA4634
MDALDAPRGDDRVGFGVLLVAHVADRLGLAGAGPNIVRARDKRLMRETWRDAGVPIPRRICATGWRR